MIKLLSTWSKLTSEKDLVSGIQLATHQKEVWDAIRDPKIQVIFDTALTGDGKTLAGLLPALYERRLLDKALFAYPTNELIRDQVRQVEEWRKKLNIEIKVGELNGAKLATYIRDEGFSKVETLRNIASDNEIILTNPDIFTLIHRLHYDRRGVNIARVAQTWLNQYRYIISDEFHIFNAPQIANVLDGIAFNRATLGERFAAKFLFLSATPDSLLVKTLEKANIIPKIVRGEYAHGLKHSTTHRRILHEVQLDLVTCEQSIGGIEKWVNENLEDIRQFFVDYPSSKGLIITNSVFSAKRVVRILRNSELNISIGENTGMSGFEARKDSMQKQLIVATSTVDVGVDFAINFLVYESLDAGTFIQRLGRLGRHDGFPLYKAIALVPDWVKEKFTEAYVDEVEVERESFFRTVREEIYNKPQEFQGYLSRWGSVLSTIRYCLLSNSKQKEQYQTLLERYPDEATRLIGKTPQWGRLNEFKEHKIIIKELESFRGTGQLDIWVNDPDTNAITSINLLRLLAGTDFTLIQEDDAKEITEKLNQPFYKNNLGLYASIECYLDRYETVELHFTDDLARLNLNIAQERKGFRIKARYRAIQQINERLERLPLTTCVADPIQYDIPALRRRYSLPPFFELQAVTDRTGTKYPVAFGLDALLLDSLLHWQKLSGAIIVGG